MKATYGKVITASVENQEISARVGSLWVDLQKKADGEFKNPEDFLYLASSAFVPEVKFPAGIKHVVLVGIGGSSLAPKAVYDTLFGYYDKVTSERFPKLHLLENVDQRYADQLMTQLSKSYDYSQLAFVIICKSGRTFETLKNLEVITQGKYRGVVRGDNTYVVSVEGNHTWLWGQKFGAWLFPMPMVVSGRFSVFGAVGVIPLGLAGVDVGRFLDGAKTRTSELSDVQKNVATRFKFYTDGWTSDVYFAFDDRLKSMAEWMCSITAESLGKAGAGITPISSVGSKDNHATLQLYLQGRRDKFTFFITLSDTDKYNLTTLDAVKKAYDEANLPYAHIVLEAGTPQTLAYELGGFMQSWIIHTVLLGGLMGLDPYNQPGVELYKRHLL